MTTRLYYSEPYRRSFDATVLSVDAVAGHSAVTLDQTAFYPTSGGQPFDTGTLGGAAVTDVIDRDDGVDRACRVRIAEGRAKSSPARSTGRGASITCSSTPASTCCRRRSIGLFGVRTESFHMGQLSSTIDLAREVSDVGDRQGRRRRESHRLGGSAGRDSVCDGGRSGGDAAAEGIGADRVAAPDRRAGLRPVRLRRHARRADRRDRHHRRSAAGRSSRADRASSSSAVAGRCSGSASGAARCRRCRSICRCRRSRWRPRSNGCRTRRSRSSGRSADSRRSSPLTKRRRSSAVRKRSASQLIAAEALEGWDPQGLKAIAVAATTAQPDARRGALHLDARPRRS